MYQDFQIGAVAKSSFLCTSTSVKQKLVWHPNIAPQTFNYIINHNEIKFQTVNWDKAHDMRQQKLFSVVSKGNKFGE